MSMRHGDIRGIVFDKDGVLFDLQRTWGPWLAAMIQALADGSHDRALRLADLLDFDLTTQRFQPGSLAIAGTTREVANAIAPVLPGREAEEIWQFLDGEGARVTVRETVPLRQTLGALRDRGLTLGVATNDTEVGARAHLRSVGAEGIFDFIAGCDSGFGAKPDPGMCLAFAQTTGIAPEALVMVGDSTHDIHAGRAAGFTCVAVLTGVATADDLAPSADAVLPDIAALGAWLDGR
ncbi:HAD family hydrolase [Jannaschia sp. CCS1]|uniref:HAD family hydrolase n=1 Tax=Jannaschia sp. (strain CCS1) TaxID=290400 RepID=UPI000053DE0F|nr:HAD-superfamily hydrolase subfamily IA variant 1 [Jannaschia sp. CCS1]